MNTEISIELGSFLHQTKKKKKTQDKYSQFIVLTSIVILEEKLEISSGFSCK